VVPRVRVDDDGLAEGAQDTFEERQLHRPIFTLEEGWLLGRFGSLDVKLGKQIFAWGTGDILNPTDVVNPVDYSDLIDSEKIGVPAADAALYIGESSRVRLVLVPTYTPSRLPPEGHRFSPLPPGGVFFPAPTPSGVIGPVPVADRDFPARTPEDAQIALRGSTTVQVLDRGFDLSATYWYGWNRLPVLTIDPRADPFVPVELTPRYDRIHMIGADVSTTVSDFEVHAEGAQFLTEGERDDDYLQYVVGSHYTRGDILAAKDELRLILEYAGEWVTHHAKDEDVITASSFSRAFESAVLGRVAYKPIEHLELQTTVAFLVKKPTSAFIQPQASYELGSHTKIKAGFDILEGNDDSFFGQYDKEDRFWMSLKLSF
ncbi:MAG TPA: DUF1302 family protein, partial [Planctomycetota bacterium]|nr:DUF1302 family protein [Planctomycetota bacterium]